MTSVLLNDFKRQWTDTGAAVLEAVQRVGESGWYILGDSVARFERAFAASAGASFAVGCASGLDAIEIALRALGLEPGQRVLTTPLTAFATTLAIVRAGGVPVFADVDARGNLDLEKCGLLLERRRDIRYMVPVHLYGHSLDLGQLSSLQERFGVRIVEDCAQAVGARFAGRPVGSVGDLAAFSFYPTKNLGAMGDAGAISGRHEAQRAACSSLRNYGQSTRYVHDRLGLNSRLDELHAAILEGAFLPRLPEWTARRRQIAHAYRSAIQNPAVTPLPVATEAEPAWHLFAVAVPPESRQGFHEHLQRAGEQSAVHYPRLVPDQEALNDVPFEVEGELSRARALAASEVSLPMHPYLREDEVSLVIDAVNSFRQP
jgi:dTDP-3-amino-3,4,6-trideoxy-alpha-D-glucose transaminase